MESRVDKFNNTGEAFLSRTKKNASLYKKVNEAELEDFDVNSNTAIIETNNSGTINVDKLRDMLDKKYREAPRKVSLARIEAEKELAKLNLDETREYDINEILNKAKEEDDSSYEVERLKKLRNTGMDILNGLDINSMHEKEQKSAEEQHLVDLINTINLKETIAKEGADPLDILSDLKGDDDNTKILGAKEDFGITTKEAPVIKGLDSKITKENPQKETLEETSMLTKTNTFTESDFDDFNDLKEEVASTKIVIKILIVIVVIAFLVGGVFLLNKILNLGLF